MTEGFTRFRKIDLIKMWRTLKAESGYRMIEGFGGLIFGHNCTLRELMEAHEKRVVEIKEQGK